MTSTKPAKGATLDTGFLIAVERRLARALALQRTFQRGEVLLTPPAKTRRLHEVARDVVVARSLLGL